MHSVRMLLDFLPFVLVEQRGVPWTCHSSSVVPLACRQQRRTHGAEKGGSEQQHELVPLPHNSELLKSVPQGLEPGFGYRGDQKEFGFCINDMEWGTRKEGDQELVFVP
jgi:hypothetical protein